LSKPSMKKMIIAAVTGAVVVLAAGCGEKQPFTVYKKGEYQGKPDTRPWDNDQFKSDRTAWEKAVKARNASQNEYARATN
jgi:outer membrane murein-binding lipoprotein Lpp